MPGSPGPDRTAGCPESTARVKSAALPIDRDLRDAAADRRTDGEEPLDERARDQQAQRTANDGRGWPLR